MDEKVTKQIVENISDILGIGRKSVFDGFFSSEAIEHNIDEEQIVKLIDRNPDWTSCLIYKAILIPVVILIWLVKIPAT